MGENHTFSSLPKRLSVAAAIACILAGAIQGQEKSPQPVFRILPNGGISVEDMLKLTRQAPTRDRISDDQLEKIKSKNKIHYDQSFKKPPEQTKSPRGDLYANSQIITAGATHTIVPKRSLLHVPEDQKV